jgi:hypothetical protein
MASIWFHKPGKFHPDKVEGHLSGSAAVAKLKSLATTIARDTGAKLFWIGELEAKLVFPNGKPGSVYLEPYSPSSKPETGQGRVWDKSGGILRLNDGTLVPICQPKGKEAA